MGSDTSDIILTEPRDVDAELDALVKRHRAANTGGLRLLTMLGTRAESLLDRLPEPVRANMLSATENALHVATRAAARSRDIVADQPPWANRAVTTTMGAMGGVGGLPGALVELPLTTTMLLRAIQAEAARQGFDPATKSVQFDCVHVFSAAGPLAQDDGSDTSFLTLRLALTGHALEKMIATVAPKLAAALSQKLAAQTLPVLGAVAGASTNYIFTKYYQEMAHVHFGLRRLAIDADSTEAAMVSAFKNRMITPQ